MIAITVTYILYVDKQNLVITVRYIYIMLNMYRKVGEYLVDWRGLKGGSRGDTIIDSYNCYIYYLCWQTEPSYNSWILLHSVQCV